MSTIDVAVRDLLSNSQRAQSLFAKLTGSQLNWKPSAERWSVAECLDHLIVSNRTYYSSLDDILAGRYAQSLYLRLPLLPSFFASLLISALKNPKMKSKTIQSFEPTHAGLPDTIVADFVKHNEELSARFQALRKLDCSTTIIRSAFNKNVIYTLDNMMTILVVHEQRHIAQAQRVMEMKEFPR